MPRAKPTKKARLTPRAKVKSKEMGNRKITGVQLVSPGQSIRTVSIAFSGDGRIDDISTDRGGDVMVDGVGELYALPGFIDIHTHGANGADIASATKAAVSNLAEAKLREGVTTFLPTTWTTSAEHLEAMVAAAAAYRGDQTFSRAPSLHIEGPYLNASQAGAQDPSLMRLPDSEEIARLNQICPIGIVSLAIELDGALPFIAKMKDLGILTSAAHSAATMAEYRLARQAGLQHLTHFCNQMSRLHHREIGLVGAGLLDPTVNLEMICDTIHLCEDMIALVFKLHSLDHIMLITDSIKASHLSDGQYPQGRSHIIVKDGAARIPEGNLAGSTLQFHHGLRHVARITGLPLHDLVKTTSTNQARTLGLTDRGEIRPGLLGDIVLLTKDYEVEMTFVGGELKYRR